jgi:hypothetical protein
MSGPGCHALDVGVVLVIGCINSARNPLLLTTDQARLPSSPTNTQSRSRHLKRRRVNGAVNVCALSKLLALRPSTLAAGRRRLTYRP